MSEAMESDSSGSMSNEKYEALLKCVDKFVESICDKPGVCKKLAKSFPKCYKENPEIVRVVSDHVWERVAASQKSHIASFMEEVDIKSSLARLDAADTVDGRAWRPSGDPSDDVKAQLCKVNEEAIQKLSGMVQRAASESDVLSDELRVKERRLRSLMEEIQTDVERWEEMSIECKSRSDDVATAYQQLNPA